MPISISLQASTASFGRHLQCFHGQCDRKTFDHRLVNGNIERLRRFTAEGYGAVDVCKRYRKSTCSHKPGDLGEEKDAVGVAVELVFHIDTHASAMNSPVRKTTITQPSGVRMLGFGLRGYLMGIMLHTPVVAIEAPYSYINWLSTTIYCPLFQGVFPPFAETP